MKTVTFYIMQLMWLMIFSSGTSYSQANENSDVQFELGYRWTWFEFKGIDNDVATVYGNSEVSSEVRSSLVGPFRKMNYPFVSCSFPLSSCLSIGLLSEGNVTGSSYNYGRNGSTSNPNTYVDIETEYEFRRINISSFFKYRIPFDLPFGFRIFTSALVGLSDLKLQKDVDVISAIPFLGAILLYSTHAKGIYRLDAFEFGANIGCTIDITMNSALSVNAGWRRNAAGAIEGSYTDGGIVANRAQDPILNLLYEKINLGFAGYFVGVSLEFTID